MQVEMLTGAAGARFAYEPGDVIEVDDKLGEVWIQNGVAKRIDRSPDIEKAVVSAPEAAVLRRRGRPPTKS